MQIPVGILKIKSEYAKKIQELVIVKIKHLVESSTPGQNPDYFRHVEEVVNSGSPLGQLGDPLGQIQAAGIYMKAYLGLHFICNCLLDCRNCLLTSQILGLYYKLKRSNKASAVYWLRGTLLYPWSIVTLCQSNSFHF